MKDTIREIAGWVGQLQLSAVWELVKNCQRALRDLNDTSKDVTAPFEATQGLRSVLKGAKPGDDLSSCLASLFGAVIALSQLNREGKSEQQKLIARARQELQLAAIFVGMYEAARQNNLDVISYNFLLCLNIEKLRPKIHAFLVTAAKALGTETELPEDLLSRRAPIESFATDASNDDFDLDQLFKVLAKVTQSLREITVEKDNPVRKPIAVIVEHLSTAAIVVAALQLVEEIPLGDSESFESMVKLPQEEEEELGLAPEVDK